MSVLAFVFFLNTKETATQLPSHDFQLSSLLFLVSIKHAERDVHQPLALCNAQPEVSERCTYDDSPGHLPPFPHPIPHDRMKLTPSDRLEQSRPRSFPSPGNHQWPRSPHTLFAVQRKNGGDNLFPTATAPNRYCPTRPSQEDKNP